MQADSVLWFHHHIRQAEHAFYRPVPHAFLSIFPVSRTNSRQLPFQESRQWKKQPFGYRNYIPLTALWYRFRT